MSALFDFRSFLTVLLLAICSCTYAKMLSPQLFTTRTGFVGLLWKMARIGERLSPYVGLSCAAMAVSMLTY